MGYTIGVSSGYWSIKKDTALLGIDRKIQWAATAGVRHTQVDIENITELIEPKLKDKVERTKKLGLTFGFHGEAKAYKGMDTMPLTSAIEPDYFRAHERLLIHIRGCGELGGKYINSHASESSPLIILWHELQPTTLVDVWGRKLSKFLEENDDLLEWAISQDFIEEIGHWAGYPVNVKTSDKAKEYAIKNKLKSIDQIPQDALKKIHHEARREVFKEYFSTADQSYGPERVAYYIIAKWMMKKRDPLWMNIVGRIIKDEELSKPKILEEWVPAVAGKYIWGHFNPKPETGYSDPKPLLEKYKIYWLFETSMGISGYELYMRLGRLKDMYYTSIATGSKWVGVTMDMEHMMGCNLDPKKEIELLPPKAGERLKLIHITVPTSHNPSHLPIYMASEAQLYIYERLYELRKKGFKDGWWIFERGGEEGQIKQTTLAMRKVREFLEKNIEPKELPLEFFGMKPAGPEISRQRVIIQEHKMDPLKGLLHVSEEEFTFLGTAARQRGKLEEWKKERYR